VAFDYDEDNPTGAMFIADFPDNEQAHRLAVVSSALVDHDAEGLGEHLKVSLQPLADDPASSSDAGFIYTKVDNMLTELFYMDDQETVVQLTVNGSASPDKLPLAGGTMAGDIIFNGTAEIKLLNALAVLGQDVAVANYRNLIRVDDSDVCDIGDQSLDGGLRLNADDIDSAVIDYSGGSDKKIWHAGHFALPPLATQEYDSGLLAIAFGDEASGSDTHGIAGGTPSLWTCELEAVGSDMGYSSGDRIQIMGGGVSHVGSTYHGLTVYADEFAFRWEPENNPLLVVNVGGSTRGEIDPSDWRIRFRAWY
jgi:hypothetical protein